MGVVTKNMLVRRILKIYFSRTLLQTHRLRQFFTRSSPIVFLRFLKPLPVLVSSIAAVGVMAAESENKSEPTPEFFTEADKLYSDYEIEKLRKRFNGLEESKDPDVLWRLAR